MTLKEIAELAGTSRGTVDRVLHGRGNVSPELRSRVLRIASENDYQPNLLARALINSRNHIKIGVIICSIGNPFFDEVLNGIYYRARKLGSYGLELIVKEIKGYSAKEQIVAVEELLSEEIDGLAITPVNVDEVQRYLSGLEIPIVTFNTDIDIPKLAFVGCDYYNSGKISGNIARLILGSGGKVAIVIGSLNIAGHRDRVSGFLSGVEGLPNIDIVAELENEDDDSLSYKAVSDMIRSFSPDLIYFGAAGIEGGITAVLESGRQIRIITVDDTETVRRYLKQGIISATVTQQPFVQGDDAIKILFDFLANGKSPRAETIYTHNQILMKDSILQH